MPKRESKAADEEQERLEAFIKDPPPHARRRVRVRRARHAAPRGQAAAEEAQVVDCGTIETEADAERWVKARAAREKVTLEPAAVRALVERAGLDIVRLRAGLERVSALCDGAAGDHRRTMFDSRCRRVRRRRPTSALRTRSGGTTCARRSARAGPALDGGMVP